MMRDLDKDCAHSGQNTRIGVAVLLFFRAFWLFATLRRDLEMQKKIAHLSSSDGLLLETDLAVRRDLHLSPARDPGANSCLPGA